MTDTELADYLHLTPAEAAIIIPKLTPEKRATYDRMQQFEVDWNLHLQGGPRPDYALIDTERSTKRRARPGGRRRSPLTATGE